MRRIIDIVMKPFGKYISSVSSVNSETSLMAIGALLSKQQLLLDSTNLNDYEFKIFSQFGDDGIIQYLIRNVKIENNLFIEFGVEDYIESNTRFLMMNNNWSGYIMDGSDEAIKSLETRTWYWKHELTHKSAFIDKGNINGLLDNSGFSDIGILSIDIDGNDYHIFEEINLKKINPAIIIMEYNSVFGKERLITVPYDKVFFRTKAHYSNLYWGASLPALDNLASKRGYSLVGCNTAGINAYFVRKDLLNAKVKEVSIDIAYRESKIRESRDEKYSLSFLTGKKRLEVIKGLDVLNVETNQFEKL